MLEQWSFEAVAECGRKGDIVTQAVEGMGAAGADGLSVADVPDATAALLAGATGQARAAIVDGSGADSVGEYLGVSSEGAATATHRFRAHLPGYQGWQWAVVVAAYPGADRVTVSEVVLVPGPTALLAPEWVPWEQRIQPGDLGPGDLLAPARNDPRLVPGYMDSGDPQIDEVAAEIGLGRRWVMSAHGRSDAAERWQEGDYGSDSAMARSTKRVCRDCGFLLPMAGSLGEMFGVCGNEMSADGHVVDKQYGCGAHSDTPAAPTIGTALYDPFDDGVLEVFDVPVHVAVESALDIDVMVDTIESPVAAGSDPETTESEITESESETTESDPDTIEPDPDTTESDPDTTESDPDTAESD